MEEWIANPQWWLSTIVSALIGFAIQYVYRHGRRLAPSIMSGAKGRIRAVYRRRKCKRLKKIKAIRFDSVSINREIALSYALLVLFMTTGVATIAAIISLPAEIQKSYSTTFLVGMTMAIPALLFESAWLKVSSRVDDILKHRKLIKRRGRGLY
ncbi:hypothetical protein QN412_03145 [Pseudomonas sp. RTB3]|uniref:hypothetical protein n=1 Tax=unclassified Pseudomonas TaxID=196821 RepID=UPI002B226559|nr:MULTISPECIES: hypothetical protein [unclassified Pseudomonas]MEB0008613.1 hypothetical protein [Pseudomonas sp. RTB2]MEB0015951.1 hypothetical protein [Pseudomonas sp. RTB3]MEB0271807.1 hypothetical protein [Pseudomonas sp. 5B4]